ncbi:MAG: hypothetical protein WCJ26_12950 [bacterium]
MRYIALILGILLLPSQFPANFIKTAVPATRDHKKVISYACPELTIPLYFKTLIRNHAQDFAAPDSAVFNSVCSQFDLDPADSGNKSTFYTLDILHKLFTAKTCSDGSRGDILNIPYLWHWTEPNPRHNIYFTENGKPLTSVRHPKGFEKYATWADIDRTPYVFLTDLLAPEPRYYSAAYDTFSTFGWCSEREMAFVSLTTLMGYKSFVIAPGNHSWTELDVTMKLRSGGTRQLLVTADNTFDQLSWTESDPGDRTSRYNSNAHSGSVLKSLKSFVVSSPASNRIEEEVVRYLENNLALCRKD